MHMHPMKEFLLSTFTKPLLSMRSLCGIFDLDDLRRTSEVRHKWTYTFSKKVGFWFCL